MHQSARELGGQRHGRRIRGGTTEEDGAEQVEETELMTSTTALHQSHLTMEEEGTEDFPIGDLPRYTVTRQTGN